MIVAASFIENVQYNIEIVRNKIPIWKMKRNIEFVDDWRLVTSLDWLNGLFILFFISDFGECRLINFCGISFSLNSQLKPLLELEQKSFVEVKCLLNS